MKTSLSHLPENKQQQILHVVEIIKSVVNPEKIILFGSYAKGTFVEHKYRGKDGITYEYISDYDFLVVTKNNPERTSDQDSKIEAAADRLKPELNLEIHEIDYINEGLEFGQYFFSDIVREGVLLFDTGRETFAEPKILTQIEKQFIAQRYYDTWFPQGVSFLKTVQEYLLDRDLKIGAFLAHQSAESFYYATLLVFTDYKPKIHNLTKLRKQAKLLSEELFFVFPIKGSKHEKHLFELLKRGYIDARYRQDYHITKGELSQILIRLDNMKIIVEKLCLEKIASLVRV